jgi:hypothetical protein
VEGFAECDHNPEAKKSTAESVKKTEQERPRKPQKASESQSHRNQPGDC